MSARETLCSSSRPPLTHPPAHAHTPLCNPRGCTALQGAQLCPSLAPRRWRRSCCCGTGWWAWTPCCLWPCWPWPWCASGIFSRVCAVGSARRCQLCSFYSADVVRWCGGGCGRAAHAVVQQLVCLCVYVCLVPCGLDSKLEGGGHHLGPSINNAGPDAGAHHEPSPPCTKG